MDLEDRIKRMEDLFKRIDQEFEKGKTSITIGNDFKTDDYNWFHSGEGAMYQGKLEMLKELFSAEFDKVLFEHGQ